MGLAGWIQFTTTSLLRREHNECVKTFRKLPRQFADVVMLCDVQEFSYKEIRQTLGAPIATVVSRLSSGRQLPRAQIAECASQSASGELPPVCRRRTCLSSLA